MSSNNFELSPITRNLLQRISGNRNAILQYDPTSRDLCAWPWPIDERLERINLCRLADHRASHKFTFPCCLCSSKPSERGKISESAIFIVAKGRHRGQYISACAENLCGYWVPLELFYPRIGIPVKVYERRHVKDTIPPPVVHVSEAEEVEYGPLIHNNVATIGENGVSVLDRPVNLPPSETELLMRLDNLVRPGLTKYQFANLFVECRCGIVTTRRTFRIHECLMDETGISLPVGGLPILCRPANPPPSESELIARLDALIRPGLRTQEFKRLFASCRCGLVVSRQMFAIHECVPMLENGEVIDLSDN